MKKIRTQFKKGDIPWNKGRRLDKECLACFRVFNVIKARELTAKFCSLLCSNRKGIAKNTGRTHFKKGEVAEDNNSQWKGKEASYSAKHHWIKRKLGKPCKCELCGTVEKRKYHWANISGKYLRDLKDYFQLCVPCHKKYDLEKKYA